MSIQPRSLFRIGCALFLSVACLACVVAQAQTTTYSLGTTALLVGPSAGTNSVVLGVTNSATAWTNTANATWLHLSTANQHGAGSTNVIFTYDANPGATRSNTLTLAGQTISITQAGSTYVAAGALTTLVSSGLAFPDGLAVDSAGNVYIADYSNNAVKVWTATNNTVTTLVSSGLVGPRGLQVDGAGNVYIADPSNNLIQEWAPSISTLLTAVQGLTYPTDLAVDGATNIYIVGGGPFPIYECPSAHSQGYPLIGISGLVQPYGVKLDAAHNLYFADTTVNEIKKYNWTGGSSSATTLVSSGLDFPIALAVDGGGNVFIADYTNKAIKKWSAVNSSVSTLATPGLGQPASVTVDASGNVYIADATHNTVDEVPYAFVDPSPRMESPPAGSDVLPVVLPATANLLPPFAPASDQSWLTIGSITNRVVRFSFTTNETGSNRTAHITLFGQSIPVTQASIVGPPTLSSGPQGETLGAGNNGTLTVAASGPGLSYQWLINGTNLAGATGSALNLGALQFSNAGLYSVIVSNASGTVTSAVAVLNVVPQLSAQQTNGNIVLSWPGAYVLQAAGQLSGPFADVTNAASPYLESTATHSQRFYRLRSMPFLLSGTNHPGAGFSVASAGIPGCNFVVQASSNLVTWQPLQTNPSPFTVTDTNAGNDPSRFYRAAMAH